MAKSYRVGLGTRAVNRVFATMTRLGVGNGYRHILTVKGRKSGRPYSTPVDVMSAGGERWLVAAYGVSNWVRNARAAGEVGLSRGGRSQNLRVVELGPEESVPVLRQYLREVPVTRAYFDVTPDSTDEEFAAESARHPVFHLVSFA
ncbi:nitroreductase family deazaflavin-dependent oxidoreductase [Streptomyces sp. NPDC005480]|uniref:nitroreductase family deazaflavin-dependent oxidoreductase n=1 Tax=Streptomyces sp. NPDC005480 TaxID=3154880 RepID=UPI0033A0A847